MMQAEEGSMRRVLTVLSLMAVVAACEHSGSGGLGAASIGVPAPAPAQNAAPAKPATFDSARAWNHLRQMVAIGPRESGSAAIKQTRAYLTKELTSYGLKVDEQAWTAPTPAGPVEMVNLIVRLPGKRADRILITGHYDTKRSKEFTFVGASDGASSAAMLVELARVLKDQPRELTYELVWFDGEEAVCWDWYECGKPGAPDNTYGSRHYVATGKKDGTLASAKAMVLLDMVGDRDLVMHREGKSTPWLADMVWAAAKRLGHTGAFAEPRIGPIEDDHVPFLDAGVPSVDIIDLDYPHWHRATDNLDNVSARSLQTVGEVVLAALPDVEKRLAPK
jgi:glutaminyl-peptide cyclotransferase